MKAEAVYVVTTPDGHISDNASFNEGQATRRYVRQWLHPNVSISDYLADQLWREFEKSGWRVNRIDLPGKLDGKPVCFT